MKWHEYTICCRTCWVKCEGSFEVEEIGDTIPISEKNCVDCCFNGGDLFRWKSSNDIASNMREDLIEMSGGYNV